MKRAFLKGLAAVAIATTALSLEIPVSNAQIEVGTSTPVVSNAGTLNRNNDHFVEVTVNGDMPLVRLKVVCVTFHELSGVVVLDPETGAEIPHSFNPGFEEFTLTFPEPVEAGKSVRIVMTDSRVRGRRSGLSVPYQVFATYPSIGEDIPIGTAVITIPPVTNR
ncbi:MAG: hypothetical protein VKL39_12445 [Leptolyngbyaceae bacterium]|nr:hypothetical protein [Leptolyngbyaceae bacterium]